MEDQEPPIDAHLRNKALQLAISAYVDADLDPNEAYSDVLIDVANKFYQFLKGETK